MVSSGYSDDDRHDGGIRVVRSWCDSKAPTGESMVYEDETGQVWQQVAAPTTLKPHTSTGEGGRAVLRGNKIYSQ